MLRQDGKNMPPGRKDLPETAASLCEPVIDLGENVVWRARVFKKLTSVS
jgi:hypothetical protein